MCQKVIKTPKTQLALSNERVTDKNHAKGPITATVNSITMGPILQQAVKDSKE